MKEEVRKKFVEEDIFGLRKTGKCLWCGIEFEWDDSMYKFCTPCLGKLKECEKIIDKGTKHFGDFIESLELVLIKYNCNRGIL